MGMNKPSHNWIMYMIHSSTSISGTPKKSELSLKDKSKEKEEPHTSDCMGNDD